MPMPVEMTPIEVAAGNAILVGDPRRAFALAQELTVQPRMSHQARGLWGYRGTTQGGLDLTVQSTGVGGPSAVPVIGDLIGQGMKLLIRLGTCLALDPDLEAGELVLVEEASARDGASRKLSGDRDFAFPDPALLEALDGLGRRGCVSSHDLVARYEPPEKPGAGPDPAIVRDLQTATTLAMSTRFGLAAAALLIVVEDRSGKRLDEEPLWDLFRKTGLTLLERLPKANT